MKYLFFLFISLNLYSQDVGYLKSHDTVYIVLKEIKTPLGKATITQFKNIESNTVIDKVFNNYYFTSLDTSYQTVVIKTRIHKDNLAKLNRKKFLKEKSEALVNVNFVDSLGLKHFFIELLKVNRKSKVVYIVDQRSLIKRNLVLRKAFIVDMGFAKM